MALIGHLSTVPISDLLQWLATARKSGLLKVQRHAVEKKIHFDDGRIVGVSSNEQPARIGQLLLSQGKITEEQLRYGLQLHESTGEQLAEILEKMGAISAGDIDAAISVKARETLFGIFEWDDAVFRFEDEGEDDPHRCEIDLDIQTILLDGFKRYDEMQRFREAFPEPGIVLQRTEAAPPEGIRQSRMAMRIYESIDGARTLAELLLHAHAPEFLVMKFLFELQRRGLVAVSHVEQQLEAKPAIPEVAEEQIALAASGGGPVAVSVPGPQEPQEVSVADEIRVAMHMLDRGENEAALELLNASSRAHPADTTLRQLVARAEQAFVEAQHELDPRLVPVLVEQRRDELAGHLTAEASFLPSMIDGTNDIKSILWLAPMRSIDVLRALRQLLDHGIIELQEPASD